MCLFVYSEDKNHYDVIAKQGPFGFSFLSSGRQRSTCELVQSCFVVSDGAVFFFEVPHVSMFVAAFLMAHRNDL